MLRRILYPKSIPMSRYFSLSHGVSTPALPSPQFPTRTPPLPARCRLYPVQTLTSSLRLFTSTSNFSSRPLPTPPSSGWGAPVEWADCALVASRPVGPDLHLLTMDLGDRAAAYTVPGQYVQFRVKSDDPGAKSAYLALFSPPPPNGTTVDLLVKAPGTDAPADRLLALSPTTPANPHVECSPVSGNGFDFTKAPASSHPDLLVLCTGSGVAPIRALLSASGANPGQDRRQITVYYGCRSPAHDVVKGEKLTEKWPVGTEVRTVYSEGGSKYVQEVLREDLERGSLVVGKGTAVVLVGQKEMSEAAKAVLEPRGVDTFLSNF